MNVDRKFLDLFWSISEEKRNVACKQLLSKLVDEGKKPKLQYLDYTRERLIKGLRSFSGDARAGFSQALVSVLQTYPEYTNVDQVMQLLTKHIYSASTSSKTEDVSLRHSYILCPKVLCDSERLNELNLAQLEQIFKPLFSLYDYAPWGSDVLKTFVQVLPKLSSKMVRKVFSDFTQKIWESFNQFDSDLLGEQLLFLFYVQCRMKGVQFSIDLSVKKFRKKFITAITKSSGDVTSSLLRVAREQNAIEDIWLKLKDTVCAPDATPKHRRLMMTIVSFVVCQCGDDLTQLILSECVVKAFIQQLSDSSLACFNDACSLLQQCLNTVTKSWRQKSSTGDKHKDVDVEMNEDNSLAASPSTLFTCFAIASPICDLLCEPKAPKPCQILMEQVPQALEISLLTAYSKKLVNLFLNPQSCNLEAKITSEEKHSSSPNSSAIRSFIASQLHHVLQCAMVADEPSAQLIQEVTDFLIFAGMASSGVPIVSRKNQTPITSKESTACWFALFRFLERFAHQKKPPETETSVTCPQLLLHIMQTVSTRLDSVDKSGKNAISSLAAYVQQSITLLDESNRPDLLSSLMSQLHALCCIFALSQPSPDFSNLTTLLDDLVECCRRKRSRKKPHLRDEPDWPAVLTDVLLGLVSQSSHMLRSFVRLTFSQLVCSGSANSDCLSLLLDVLKMRLNEEHGATQTDHEKLIDFSSTLTEAISDSDSGEAEEENELVPANDIEVEANESESDSESTVSDDEIDDEQLSKLRESVQRALGPAALNPDEVDSTSCREFTDAEMFAQDEALAAAFRANQLATPKRTLAGRARAVGQMKMRCLDLLQCVLQHAFQPELVFPTITQLMELGRTACEYELKKQRNRGTNQDYSKHRERVSFTARYGDIPLFTHVAQAIKCIRSRPQATQQTLASRLGEHPDDAVRWLSEAMDAVVASAQIENPLPEFVKLIATATQFLFHMAHSLKEVKPDFEDTLCKPLLKQLRVFVRCARKTTIHRTVFIDLLSRCQVFAVHAFPVLADVFIGFATQSSSSPDCDQPSAQSKGAVQYTFIQCCELLSAVCQSLVADRYAARELFSLVNDVLSLTITAMKTMNLKSQESVEHVVWLSSPSIANAFLTFLTWGIKAAEKNKSVPLFDSNLIAHLRSLPCRLKMVRKTVRRFVNFAIETNRKQGGAKDEQIYWEKQRVKRELKRARQAKRRENASLRAERQQTKKEPYSNQSGLTNGQLANTTGSEGKRKRSKKHGSNKQKEKSMSGLKTTPKPKEMKKAKQTVKRRVESTEALHNHSNDKQVALSKRQKISIS
ncbi:hypothetical protein P879_07744 [Paragonimus westermani]|uniref:Myb-binding protein 1A n=1 Tax=Paragonimus westermani TaxID=34504 RepID=A0A8T0DCU3_9TREM|nr:hypothetical protein P879_07744 [Paragonimus westermani]